MPGKFLALLVLWSGCKALPITLIVVSPYKRGKDVTKTEQSSSGTVTQLKPTMVVVTSESIHVSNRTGGS